jgi:hypothetical protein
MTGALQGTQPNRALLRKTENQPRHRHPIRSTRRKLPQHGSNRRRQILAQICPRRLGHEQVGTTDIYLHADMTIKERALTRITPAGATAGRYKPGDKPLGFLEGL